MSRRALIAGNWKMYGLAAALGELDALSAALAQQPVDADVAVCPPATLLAAAAARLKGSPILLGGQDCHTAPEGAHTGDISAVMLADAGARLVIVGHSERRRDHGETDALVRAKAEAALAAGLTPIVCVGETIEERQAGQAEAVVGRQIAGSLPERGEAVVAYEPVWAIGTGLTASTAEIAAMHAFVRGVLGARGARVRILYGGSVKPQNAQEILALEEVDGALVGGASLKAADFSAIIRALK
ncbi:MAG: triose-phosphate isomerase [Hydrogenophilaceae bacterium]|jgi:triosephosphate isomerase|nr:triose-phosphate isomerase [Hydrogenophilaceae bacterium]